MHKGTQFILRLNKEHAKRLGLCYKTVFLGCHTRINESSYACGGQAEIWVAGPIDIHYFRSYSTLNFFGLKEFAQIQLMEQQFSLL